MSDPGYTFEGGAKQICGRMRYGMGSENESKGATWVLDLSDWEIGMPLTVTGKAMRGAGFGWGSEFSFGQIKFEKSFR